MYISVLGGMMETVMAKTGCDSTLPKDDPRRKIMKILTTVHKKKKYQQILNQHIVRDHVSPIP